MELSNIHMRKETQQLQELKMKVPLSCGHVSTGIALDGFQVINYVLCICKGREKTANYGSGPILAFWNSNEEALKAGE